MPRSVQRGGPEAIGQAPLFGEGGTVQEKGNTKVTRFLGLNADFLGDLVLIYPLVIQHRENGHVYWESPLFRLGHFQ